MSQEGPGGEIPVQRLEADAVCEQCGTVNPEETLLCKKCGNNLRDQRMRRVAAGGLEGPARARFNPQVLRALLALFAILVVLWVALNVNNIEDYLVQGFQAAEGAESSINAAYFWDSGDSEIYESMLEELDQNPITEEEIAAATATIAPRGAFAGRYCIKKVTTFNETVIGEALVREDGDVLRFVARIAPDVEIRGEGEPRGISSLETRLAGAKVGQDRYLDVVGTAVWSREGGYACYGLAGPNDEEYAAAAYRIR